MMPVASRLTAIERSVMECAWAGCETIWIICNDDTLIAKSLDHFFYRSREHFFIIRRIYVFIPYQVDNFFKKF